MGGGKLEARELRKPSRFVGRERGRCFYAFAKSRIPRVSWDAEWECSGIDRARSAGDLPRPTPPRRGAAREDDLVVWVILNATFLVRDNL